jgi:hypothetical protein
MTDGRFDAVLRSLTESRRSVLGGAAATVALLGTRQRGAARKPKQKGKGKCPKGLKKVSGRCARTCQDSGDCGRAGYCMPTYTDGDSGPKVCVLINGLFALSLNEQCDLLEAQLCDRPGECGKNESCVVSAACLAAFCAATHFP